MSELSLEERAKRAFDLDQEVQRGKEDARMGLLRVLMALDELERTGLFEFMVTDVEAEKRRLSYTYRRMEEDARKERVRSILFKKYLNEQAKVGNALYVKDRLRCYRTYVRMLGLSPEYFNSVDSHHLIALLGTAHKMIEEKGAEQAKEEVEQILQRAGSFSREDFQRLIDNLREGKEPAAIENCTHQEVDFWFRCKFCREMFRDHIRNNAIERTP